MKISKLQLLLVSIFFLSSPIQGTDSVHANLVKKIKKGAKKAKKGTSKKLKKAKKKLSKAASKAKFAAHAQLNKVLKHFPPEMKSLSKEKAWYRKLPEVQIRSLKPGDILLKKDYRDYKKTSPVIEAQTFFQVKRGSKYTVHTFIYLGRGKIAEASHSKNGVWVGKLSDYGHPEKMRLLIYRRKSRRAIRGALKVAKAYCSTGWTKKNGKKAKIKYSNHGITSGIRSWKFNKEARKEAKRVSQLNPPKSMMCSQFVILCYQYKKVSIRLNARYAAPIRLENYLNTKGAKDFKFLGKLKW